MKRRVNYYVIGYFDIITYEHVMYLEHPESINGVLMEL